MGLGAGVAPAARSASSKLPSTRTPTTGSSRCPTGARRRMHAAPAGTSIAVAATHGHHACNAMRGCMRGRVHGCMYVCMYVLLNVCVSVCTGVWMDGCMHVCVDDCMYGCTDGRMDGWMDGWMRAILSWLCSMERDRIAHLYIRLRFNNDATWTKAMKCLLTNLKW